MTPILNLSLLWALVGQMPDFGPLDTDQDARLAEMRRVVAASEIYALEGDGRRKLSLRPQPLMRFQGRIRGNLDGTLWAFGDESGRPSALYKVGLHRNKVGRGFVTLSDHLLECHFTKPGADEPRPLFANTRTFSTKRPGLAWKSFPDQPPLLSIDPRQS